MSKKNIVDVRFDGDTTHRKSGIGKKASGRSGVREVNDYISRNRGLESKVEIIAVGKSVALTIGVVVFAGQVRVDFRLGKDNFTDFAGDGYADKKLTVYDGSHELGFSDGFYPFSLDIRYGLLQIVVSSVFHVRNLGRVDIGAKGVLENDLLALVHGRLFGLGDGLVFRDDVGVGAAGGPDFLRKTNCAKKAQQG